MSDPYIPEEDRIDVIGRLTARLDQDGGETLREKAAAATRPKEDFDKDPGTFEKPDKEVMKEEKENKDNKELKEEKEITKDGTKDDKDTKEDEKDTKEFGEKDIKDGDKLVTAGFTTETGLASLYPADIPIGEVVETIPAEQEQREQVNVEPFADLADLTDVTVLTSGGG